jgi:mannan endo-1,4-beta-mannosidase
MIYKHIRNTIGLFILLHISYTSIAQDNLPADKNATKETVALYKNLGKIKEKGFMFGHQDDLAYGVNWRYEKGRSDVKESAGDFPAVYGYDLCGLEQNNENNLDGVPFKKIRQYIKDGYAKGAVITLSWHFRSPLGAEKGAWDTTHGTVTSILPGGVNHALFKTWLDAGAAFISSLKGTNGEAIPILFRPFHELTGSWFWWGKNECTEEQFITLFRFVNYYFKDVKKLHNLLYVYNTSDNFKTKEEFLLRYPGDDIIDMISFDAYQYEDPTKNDWFVKNVNSLLNMICEIGTAKNKLVALAETGYEAIPYAEWWTQTLLKAIGNNKISYVLLWRNHGMNNWNNPPRMHYYVPYKGQVSEADFKKFYDLDITLFEKEVNAAQLYQ